jgi:hypothetical protein
MRQQDRALGSQRLMDDLAFLVADRRSRPFRQSGAIVMEHRGVHVRGDERATDHG